MKKKPIRIISEKPFSWRQRIIIFAGVFGTTWLFLEPVFAFDRGIGIISRIGSWGYIGLVSVSILLTIAIEYFQRMRLIGRKIFFSLTIVLTDSGTRIDIEVPQDMRIGHFIELCFDYLGKYGVQDRVIAMREFFNWFLEVEKEGGSVKLPKTKTFLEAKVPPGAICKFYRGKVNDKSYGKALELGLIKQTEVILSWSEKPMDLDLYVLVEGWSSHFTDYVFS